MTIIVEALFYKNESPTTLGFRIWGSLFSREGSPCSVVLPPLRRFRFKYGVEGSENVDIWAVGV